MSLLYEVYIMTAPDFKSRARTNSPSGEMRGFGPVTNEFSVRRQPGRQKFCGSPVGCKATKDLQDNARTFTIKLVRF